MKFRTTIILLLLTGALVAFIFIREHHQPTTKEKISQDSRPFQFSPADADEIQIERKDDTLHLVLRDGTWRINRPFEDFADPELIKQLLESLSAVEWIETLERKDLRKEDFKRTGLGDDSVTIDVRAKGKLLAAANWGGPAALEGCVYASLPSQTNLIRVAKTSLPSLLGKTNDEWRDPKLVRLKRENISRLTFNAGSGSMEFTRAAGQPWQFVRPLQTRANDQRVNQVLNALLNLDVKPAKNGARVPAAAVDVPEMTITLEGAGLAKPVLVTLNPNADVATEVLLQADHREGVFMGASKVPDFWHLRPIDLRSRDLVRIPPDQATALRIRSLIDAEVVLDKQGATWMLNRFGKKEPANQERVTRLIETLNATQVRDFLSDAGTNLEPWGLHQPFLSIEWQAAGKTSILEFGQGPEGILTARVRDEPFIYSASTMHNGSNLFSAIPTDSLRWRSTKVINVTIFAVRRITVAEGDKPAMTLMHHPDASSWTANIAERDVTSLLDKSRANQLLQKLAEFQASDWNADRAGAIAALKNPTLTIQLLIASPGEPDSAARPVTLTFAPLQPGMDTAIYHGRKDQEPDTFFISRDLYRELTAPVVN